MIDDDTVQNPQLHVPQGNVESSDVLQIPPRPKTLAEQFEDGRMTNLRLGFRILGCNVAHRSVTLLDRFSPEELAESADEILLAHAARMAIRSVARVEQVWMRYNGNDDRLAMVPYEQHIIDLMSERDAATAYYQSVREKQAKTAHLESICTRGKTIEFSSPRLPRARRKKSSAG